MKNLGLTLMVDFDDCSNNQTFCDSFTNMLALVRQKNINVNGGIWTFVEDDPDVVNFSIKRSQLPFAIIYDEDDNFIYRTIEKANFNELKAALETDYTEVEEGSATGTNTGGGLFNFFNGDFDFGFNLPRFGWAIVGGLATYKALDSKTKVGQVGFGSIGAIAAKKYFQSK